MLESDDKHLSVQGRTQRRTPGTEGSEFATGQQFISRAVKKHTVRLRVARPSRGFIARGGVVIQAMFGYARIGNAGQKG